MEWPDASRVARALTVCCVCAEIVAVLVQLPLTIRKRDRRTDQLAALTYEDRDLAAGNSVVPDQRLVFEARALIPPDGRYRIVEGSLPIAEATDLTLGFSPAFLTSFLMPRRPANRADWVICLGCHVHELGVSPHVVWSDGRGSSIVRLSA